MFLFLRSAQSAAFEFKTHFERKAAENRLFRKIYAAI
jgi:hypothetical protein